MGANETAIFRNLKIGTVDHEAVYLTALLRDNGTFVELSGMGVITTTGPDGTPSLEHRCASCLQLRATWAYQDLHVCQNCWRKRRGIRRAQVQRQVWRR